MTKPRASLPPLTDEEEAEIQAGIAADSDNPEWTEEDFRDAKPFAEALPELAASLRRQEEHEKQGGKRLVSLPLSPDVVDAFRAGGPGWQARMDEALRKAVGL